MRKMSSRPGGGYLLFLPSCCCYCFAQHDPAQNVSPRYLHRVLFRSERDAPSRGGNNSCSRQVGCHQQHYDIARKSSLQFHLFSRKPRIKDGRESEVYCLASISPGSQSRTDASLRDVCSFAVVQHLDFGIYSSFSSLHAFHLAPAPHLRSQPIC